MHNKRKIVSWIFCSHESDPTANAAIRSVTAERVRRKVIEEAVAVLRREAEQEGILLQNQLEFLDTHSNRTFNV